ncbi:MAG: riboflavin biosynthesis protein RibF [Ruminococcus sp.]|nr:riboflavin biosynthesis protein RibF [Ruminococcus sp.]
MTEITLNDRIKEKTAAALGLFDGVHEGHELILRNAGMYSMRNYAPSVFTFRTESIKIKHGKPFEYIYTNRQKLEKISKNIRYVLSPDFDEVRNMTGEEFVEKILVNIMNVGAVVCGDNFRFGKNASCGISELKSFGEKYGFEVKISKLGENHFSSEKYRELLRNGEVEKLYPHNAYSLFGEVVRGNQIGRTINFPTVNQLYAENQLVPKFGVYRTRTFIDEKCFPSVTNIGVKPTVKGERNPLAETHILHFGGNLYGKTITVEFLEFIRPEIKFSSLDELKNQIEKDISRVKNN